MGHVYAFGTVELYPVFAAVEFGRVDGEFARSCADTERAIAGGLYSLVFAMVAVVVVAAALVVHFDVVGVFGIEVYFAAITASSKQGNKQNRQQRHLCPQAECTLCWFCARNHGVMGRGKDAGIMPVWAPSGINAGFAQKNPPQGGRFLVFAKANVSALSVVPVSSHGETARSQSLSRLAVFLSNTNRVGSKFPTLCLPVLF